MALWGQSLISFPGSSGVSFADDDYWTNGAVFTILWGGKTYSSLSSWQAATGQDSGAQSTNPRPFAGSPSSAGVLAITNNDIRDWSLLICGPGRCGDTACGRLGVETQQRLVRRSLPTEL
jgi:hypothetical protein